MPLVDAYIAELRQEAPSARATIDRIPDDKLDWRPHAKSMTFAELASHLAESLGWTTAVLEMEHFDVPADFRPWIGGGKGEILDLFDRNLEAALATMQGRADDQLGRNWKLSMGGQTMFEAPRTVVLRNFLLNHLIHHRAQLGVYLRINDVAVPSVYGPTADEQPRG